MRLATIISALLISSASAVAQQNTTEDVYNQLSIETLQCNVYYVFTAECLGRVNSPDAPKTREQFMGLATKSSEIAAFCAVKAKLKLETMTVRQQVMKDSMKEAIGNSCGNLMILFGKHNTHCRTLIQTQEGLSNRAKEIMAGHECDSDYKCEM
jgi:hypothetical protein